MTVRTAVTGPTAGRWGPRRRSGALASLGVLILAGGVLAGCSSSGATGGGTAAVGPAIPLTSSTVASSTTWATLAMGHLDDPVNTFWQLLALTTGSPWQLATPPGTATNGGLVASALPASVLAGVEPSQALRYSPLSLTTSQGATWSEGLLPDGLALVPDALAQAGGGRSIALLRQGRGAVVSNAGDLTTWTRVTSAGALAASPGAATCHLSRLTAVTVDAAGGTLVGASCGGGGRAGLFGPTSTGWTSVGPGIPGVPGGPTEVVRLDQTAAGTAALVTAGTGPATELVAMWSTNALRTWTVSAALPLAGTGLVSTGVTAAGGFVVLTGGGGTGSSASAIAPSAPSWHSLPAPPSGTASVTATPSGGYDALVPVASTLSVYGLGAQGWARVQRLQVDIQYGSSG